mgnify:CR=1 FL=1
MIEISFPDKSKRSFKKGTTPFEIAQSISEGLARNVLSSSFNENIIEIHENKLKLQYVGRKPSATTATGSSSVHKIQQKRIIDSILK